MSQIWFHNEETPFNLTGKNQVKRWLKKVAEEEQRKIGTLNIIFCSDHYLLETNKNFLNHDYYTDIITFDHSEQNDELSGDLFISTDRIMEFSKTHNIEFVDELHRVIVHGVLHLAGHNDKTDGQKTEMRKLENHYLALRF